MVQRRQPVVGCFHRQADLAEPGQQQYLGRLGRSGSRRHLEKRAASHPVHADRAASCRHIQFPMAAISGRPWFFRAAVSKPPDHRYGWPPGNRQSRHATSYQRFGLRLSTPGCRRDTAFHVVNHKRRAAFRLESQFADRADFRDTDSGRRFDLHRSGDGCCIARRATIAGIT